MRSSVEIRPTNLAEVLPEVVRLHLYAVYLGGDLAEGRMGEDHEVVFVAGSDAKDVRRRARAKWSGVGTAHVDAIRRLDVIDGYEVAMREVGGGDTTLLDNTFDPGDDI
jgi:hypothetical protein